MKKVLLLVASALALSSCEKEEVIVIKEIEKEFNWKSRAGFEYEHATQLNSFATHEHLYTLGINTFTAMLPDSVTDSRGLNYVHHNLFYQLPITAKFPISAEYFIGYSEKEPDKLRFSPTQNPATATPSKPAALAVSFAALDNTFQKFNFLGFNEGESFAINNKGQALVPYQAAEEGSTLRLKATLLDVTTNSQEATSSIDTLKTKQVSFNSYSDGFLVFLQAVNDNFYISPNYNETYRVSPDGEAVKVLDTRLYDVFKDKQNLYAIGTSGSGYVSADDGQTWRKKFDLPQEMTWLTYTYVDDRIIGYRNSQIFEIVASPAHISIKELDNDGLLEKGITSISELKGKVYISTYAGVFYKDLDDFFVERENREGI